MVGTPKQWNADGGMDKMLMIDLMTDGSWSISIVLMPRKSFQIVPRCDVQVAIVSYILSLQVADNDDIMICPKWDKVHVQ